MDMLEKALLISATALTGMLCGASLDQSIKQLPARRVIGVRAYSDYAKAADLRNGVPFYAILGVGAALTSIGTAIVFLIKHSQNGVVVPIYVAGICAVLHSIYTSQAAPLYFRQKSMKDGRELEQLFNKFERIQTIRSAFILINFIALLWIFASHL
jgi:hypothetical protein